MIFERLIDPCNCFYFESDIDDIETCATQINNGWLERGIYQARLDERQKTAKGIVDWLEEQAKNYDWVTEGIITSLGVKIEQALKDEL